VLSQLLNTVISIGSPMASSFSTATNGLSLDDPLRVIIAVMIVTLGLWLMVSAVAEWSSGEMSLNRVMWLTIRVAVLVMISGTVLVFMLSGTA